MTQANSLRRFATAIFNCSVVLAASGCSMEAPVVPGALRVVIEDPQSQSHGAFSRSFSTTSRLATLADPSATGDFNCFAVNVTGQGIGPLAQALNGCSSPNNFNGKGMGIMSRPTTRGGTVELDVPGGPARSIDVYGLYPSPPECGGTAGTGEVYGYYLGGTTANLTELTNSVTVSISFSAAAVSAKISCPNPNATPPPTLAATISAASGQTCATSGSGNAYCWGTNGNGQIGNNSSTNASHPARVTNTTGSGYISILKKISAGGSYACAVGTDGLAYCWGNNSDGRLGNSSTISQNYPLNVVSTSGTGTLGNVASIGTGANATCASNTSGQVYCWGANNSGQLGIGSTGSNQTFPVQVVGIGGSGTLSNVSSVANGTNFGCARRNDGSVACWGTGFNGQLGQNNTSDSYSPVQVMGVGGSGTLSNVTAIATGPSAAHVCSVASGNVYCWGYNNNGQLGNNSSAQSNFPVQVVGVGGSGTLTNISAVSVGDGHSCAIDNSSNAYCWGSNANGQLGNNSSGGQSIYPVQVLGVGGSGNLSNVVAIAAGGTHTCAVNASGSAYCWGAGGSGALGLNSTAQPPTPAQVVDFTGSGNLSL